MIQLFVRNNETGKVHEVGSAQYDSLCLTPNGSLHYLNRTSLVGTQEEKGGYSFCLRDGFAPDYDAKVNEVTLFRADESADQGERPALTKDMCASLVDLIETCLLHAIREDPDIDSLEWVFNILTARKELERFVKEEKQC